MEYYLIVYEPRPVTNKLKSSTGSADQEKLYKAIEGTIANLGPYIRAMKNLWFVYTDIRADEILYKFEALVKDKGLIYIDKAIWDN